MKLTVQQVSFDATNVTKSLQGTKWLTTGSGDLCIATLYRYHCPLDNRWLVFCASMDAINTVKPCLGEDEYDNLRMDEDKFTRSTETVFRYKGGRKHKSRIDYGAGWLAG